MGAYFQVKSGPLPQPVVNRIEIADPSTYPQLLVPVQEGADIGDLWDGKAFSKPPPAPITVPDDVPMAAARIILLRSNITADMLIAAINADPTTTAAQKSEALIDFEFRTSVRRHSPLTLALGSAMGLTPARMDEMFIAAEALT